MNAKLHSYRLADGVAESVPSKRLTYVLSILIATVVVIILCTFQTQQYLHRNYREDEINSVHASFIKSPSEITQWMATDVHPPGWRLFIETWIEAFGGDEFVTRWSSILLNLLTFALIFQLGKHLVDWKVGLFAIVLLGVYTFASNLMSELRPYPMLIMLVSALHLVFYRWLKHPTARLFVIYVVLGISAVYTHFFSFFIFPAHALFFVLFRKFERRVFANTLAMWVFIGLSFLSWILPFIHTILVPFPGGIYYALPEGVVGVELLVQRIRFVPEEIGLFLLLLGLCVPIAGALVLNRKLPNTRFESRWNFLYPAVILVALIVIALVANTIVSSVTARNMIILVPAIVLLMAVGLRLLPIYASIILVAILLIGAPANLARIGSSNGPYREIVATMQESYQMDSVMLTEFDEAWRWLLPAMYYVMDFTPDHMSKARMTHIIAPADRVYPPAFPDNLVNIYNRVDSQRLDEIIPPAKQLWYLIEGEPTPHRDDITSWLNENYALMRTVAWDDYSTFYSLSEYLRLPENAGLILRAGDAMELHAWSLNDPVEVQTCQTISIESWWRTDQPMTTPYTLSIVLVDDQGKVTGNDVVPADEFTTNWRTDRYYRDLNSLTIPCEIDAGVYNLLLTVYDTNFGTPLELTDANRNPIGEFYYLTTLTVSN